jgi:hypothetical protein
MKLFIIASLLFASALAQTECTYKASITPGYPKATASGTHPQRVSIDEAVVPTADVCESYAEMLEAIAYTHYKHSCWCFITKTEEQVRNDERFLVGAAVPFLNGPSDEGTIGSWVAQSGTVVAKVRNGGVWTDAPTLGYPVGPNGNMIHRVAFQATNSPRDAQGCEKYCSRMKTAIAMQFYDPPQCWCYLSSGNYKDLGVALIGLFWDGDTTGNIDHWTPDANVIASKKLISCRKPTLATTTTTTTTPTTTTTLTTTTTPAVATTTPTTTTTRSVCPAGYRSEHFGTTTCKNKVHRIAQPCSETNPCEPQDCATHCDNNANCAYFFVNAIKDCHLYSGCTETRTAGHSGETCAISEDTIYIPDDAILCPGVHKEDYCNCLSDCGANPTFCACSAAQACCAAKVGVFSILDASNEIPFGSEMVVRGLALVGVFTTAALLYTKISKCLGNEYYTIGSTENEV